MLLASPDGDFGVSLVPLRRIQELDIRMPLPAHGAPSIKPRALLADAVAHRLKREQQLLAVLAEGPASAAILAERLYEGLPEPLRPLARWQVLAGVVKIMPESTGRPRHRGVIISTHAVPPHS